MSSLPPSATYLSNAAAAEEKTVKQDENVGQWSLHVLITVLQRVERQLQRLTYCQHHPQSLCAHQLWWMPRYLKDTPTILFVISDSMSYMMLRRNSLPGRTRFFSISVPVAVALMRQTCAFSRASWPWSPHSLKIHQYKVWDDNMLVTDRSASFIGVYTSTVAHPEDWRDTKPTPQIQQQPTSFAFTTFW